MATESSPIPSRDSDRFVTREAAAEHLMARYGYGNVRFLANLALRGGGPVFYRSGRMALYRLADIDAWALGRMSGPITKTSEEAA